jgi:ligand-binding sensor domain-containing protein/two-component sensor histidine kinase
MRSHLPARKLPSSVLPLAFRGNLPFWLGLFIAFLSFGNFSFAAVPPGDSSQEPFTWSRKEDWPKGAVIAIVHGRDGYLWLGTQDGLVRWDGLSSTTFNKKNTPIFRNHVIQALLEDHDGNLWIGTEGGGLYRHRNGEFTLFSTENGLTNNRVWALRESRDGAVWVGTSSGVTCIRNGKAVGFGTSAGVTDKPVQAILEDRNGRILIGTYGDGVYRFESAAGRFIRMEVGSNPFVWSLLEDRDGCLWIGTRDGIERFKDGAPHPLPGNLRGMTVFAISQTGAGDFYASTDTGGVFRFDGHAFKQSTDQNGLPGNYIHCVEEDRDGNVWAGGLNGLVRLFRPKVLSLGVRRGLNGEMTQSLAEGGDGRVWIGTENGLNLFRNGVFETSPYAAAVGKHPVYGLLEEADGTLWVATKGAGLFRFQATGTTRYTKKELGGDVVFSVLKSRDGILWVGTWGGGLVRFINGHPERITQAQGLKSDFVAALAEASDGSLWVVAKEGVSRYFNGAFTNFEPAQGLPESEIYAVLPLPNGDVWLASDGGGLCRYRNGRFDVVTSADGLASDSIFNLVTDDRGALWCSGSQGIFRTPLAQLDERIARRNTVVTSTAYGLAEGMESEYCVGGSQSTAIRTRDGRLWFATTKGAVVADPRELEANSPPPMVHLEGVVINDRVEKARDGMVIEAGVNRLMFNFVGLDLRMPEKVRYRYKLEGFDPDWIDGANRKFAVYTNLPPAKYRFRVIATNGDGIWNQVGDGVAFVKAPRFFQTWPFYLFMCGCVVGIGWLGYRFRIRQIENRHAAILNERNRMARELHDTLVQGYVAIGSLVDSSLAILDKSPRIAEKQLKLAQRMARHSIVEARDSVHDLRSPALEKGDLVTALKDVAHRFSERFQADIQVRVVGNERPLATEVAQQLLRIGQEAVSNAIRHASPSQVRLDLHFEPSRVVLRARDDGTGFEVERGFSAIDGHFGLLGMRERAGQVNGTLKVESAPGEGTLVEVTVPV